MKFEQNWLSSFRGGQLKMLTDERTDEGQKVITIAHPEQSSGELKQKSLTLHKHHLISPSLTFVKVYP